MLLSRGYTVKGTVRDTDDKKYKHLKELEGAEERLELVKADILDPDSLIPAIRGCKGVFHTACPIIEDPAQVLQAAVKGTLNVLKACNELGVKRVILTSSIGAIYLDPSRNPQAIVDEDCWSNLDYCIETKNWYCYAKTVAEKAACTYAEEVGMELIRINPSIVLGPLLQPTMNFSTAHVLKYLTGSAKTYANVRKKPAQRTAPGSVSTTLPTLPTSYQVFRPGKSKESGIQIQQSKAEGIGSLIYAHKGLFD
ncbi:hypothetical protein SUGI_0322780 [Cryptomeria japonica]|nr:hypothetical protein SUGI_0322780 [Cryptomeria japonica]